MLGRFLFIMALGGSITPVQAQRNAAVGHSYMEVGKGAGYQSKAVPTNPPQNQGASSVVGHKPPWISITLFYEFRKNEDRPYLIGHALNGLKLKTTPQGLQQIQNYATGAKNFSSIQDWMAQIGQGWRGLTQHEKLLFFSMVGDQLLSQTQSGTALGIGEIFSRLRSGGDVGGQAGVHRFLSELHRQLGMQGTGLHSSNATGSTQDPGGGQAVVAHFKNGKTYWIQHFGRFINTGQDTLAGAIDYSTQALGTFTSLSMVENRDGKVIPHTTRIGHWVRQQIHSQTEFDPFNDTMVSIDPQSVGLKYTHAFNNNVSARIFYLHSERRAAEGRYKIDVAGVAGKFATGPEVYSGVGDYLYFGVKARAGYLRVRSPTLDVEQDGSFLPKPEHRTRHNFFASIEADGQVRADWLTINVLRLRAGRYDISVGNKSREHSRGSPADIEYRPGFVIHPSDSFRVGYERSFRVVPRSLVHDTDRLRSYFDRIHTKFDVVIDRTAQGDRRVFLINESEVFAMEGFEKMSALGIRERLKVVFDSTQLGTFSVKLDMSKFLSNKSKDPYFDIPLTYDVAVEWKKIFFNAFMFGATAGYRSGGPTHPSFREVDEMIFPDLAYPEGAYAILWIATRF